MWWIGSAGREPLHSPALDWTHQLGASRYMPTTVHHQLLGGLSCYPGVPNQLKIVGPKVAQGTVAYKGLCKVLALHGLLLTHHVSHARARYRCCTAVHTASTLEVHADHYSVLEFGFHSETNITIGFGSKTKSASFITYF